MATTMEELEQRVASLEKLVAICLGALAEGEDTPAKRGARMLQRELETRAETIASWNKYFRPQGDPVEVISSKELRDRLQAKGIRPEDNEFSRAIIAAREE
jgi:hypothetical protein